MSPQGLATCLRIELYAFNCKICLLLWIHFGFAWYVLPAQSSEGDASDTFWRFELYPSFGAVPINITNYAPFPPARPRSRRQPRLERSERTKRRHRYTRLHLRRRAARATAAVVIFKGGKRAAVTQSLA